MLKLGEVNRRNCLSVDLDSGLEVVEVTLIVGFDEHVPSLLIVHERDAEVKFTIGLTLRSEVPFLETVAALDRGLGRTLPGWMTFLIADTAGASEGALNRVIGTISLVVSA